MRAGERHGWRDAQHGIALLTVILILMLLSSLGLAVALITTFETRTAANFLAASQALRAADAGVELALPDLTSTTNWSSVLDGSSASTFTDGAAGPRTLADGRSVDLAAVVNLATCGHAAACTPAETCAVRDSRPWGPNNPRWRLYMSGALGSLAPGGGPISPSCYVVVLVADDPSETDGDPLQDGGMGQGPGAGTLLVRSEAFCPGGAHKVIEATVSRAAPQGLPASGARLVVWREIREPGA
jgi:hypothetical protein